MHRIPSIGPLLVALGMILGSGSAQACPMCMGADSTTGPALNGAIFFMLGILATVFAGIAAVVFSFWRRAKSPPPPHVELVHSLSSGVDGAQSV
jgi:hypothetical protein